MSAICALVACSDEAALPRVDTDGPTPVVFDTYMARQRDSRTVYGTTGPMTDEQLKTSGFGVLAYYTKDTPYTGSSEEPDFMYNQSVVWSDASRWTYSPLKYWPNDNRPADNQGAEGSKDKSYVTFCAYAPYVEVADPSSGYDDYSEGNNYGIVQFLGNSATAGDMYLGYHADLSKPYELGGSSNMVDMLYAQRIDMTKQAVSERVQLQFQHALARLRLTVQGVFDEAAPGYNVKDSDTRILIERVSVTGLPNLGNFYPATLPPHWTYTDATAPISINGTTIATGLRDVSAPSVATLFTNADAPAGVTNTPQPLVADDGTYLFVPAVPEGGQDITVNIKYKVYTRDEHLVRNNPQYLSIVENDISRTLTLPGFNMNAVYTINMLLGLTSVKFDVHEVDGWGTGDSKEIYVPQNGMMKSFDLIASPLECPSGSSTYHQIKVDGEQLTLDYLKTHMGEGSKFIVEVSLHENAPDYTYWHLWLKHAGWEAFYEINYDVSNDETKLDTPLTIEIPITAELKNTIIEKIQADKDSHTYDSGYKPVFIVAEGHYIWINKLTFIPHN